MTELDYRYPLPAHNIPHQEPDCGDPEWCLHEQPTERANLQIELEPIPVATEPLVVFSPSVAAIGERLHIDTEGMSHYLRERVGWTAVDAAAVRIVFNDPEEYAEQRDFPDTVEGNYTSAAIDRPASGGGGDVGYRHNVAMPIASAHLSMLGIRRLNSVLRHELGHGDCDGRFGPVRLYTDLLRGEPSGRSRTTEEEPKVFGRIPARHVAAVSEALGLDGMFVLHRLDKEERYARAFDRRHGWRLNPISLR